MIYLINEEKYNIYIKKVNMEYKKIFCYRHL